MSPDTQLTLWLGAFRYYLGRRTYAVDDFCLHLIREWPNLYDKLQDLIKKELEEAFRMEQKTRNTGHYLGIGMDRESWENVRKLWKEKT